jgi:hypothetical protein
MAGVLKRRPVLPRTDGDRAICGPYFQNSKLQGVIPPTLRTIYSPWNQADPGNPSVWGLDKKKSLVVRREGLQWRK